MAGYNDSNLRTATILSGASLSSPVDMVSLRAAVALLPGVWDAADITVLVSTDGVTYQSLYDAAGNEYTVKAAASRAVLLPIADFLPLRFIQLRSGPSGVPVPQTGDRAIAIIGVA